jgi:acyl-CoA synthetase (AMP-forming)/AMP-acid ligase II
MTSTIPSLFSALAFSYGDDPCITTSSSTSSSASSYGYTEVWEAAKAVALQLKYRYNVGQNDYVLIDGEGRSQVELVGVLAAGILKCPFVPVDTSYLHKAKHRLEAITAALTADFGGSGSRSGRVFGIALADDDASPVPVAFRAAGVHNIVYLSEQIAVVESITTLDDLPELEELDEVGEEPLYVMFTSGTSDVPKAVLGSTPATLNRLQWGNDTFGGTFAEPSIVCKSAGICFIDGLHALLAGCLFPHSSLRQLEDGVMSVLASDDVTVVTMLPSQLSVLLSSIATPFESKLRHIIVSGSPCPPELAASKHFADEGGCLRNTALWNLYGQTETCGDCLYAQLHSPGSVGMSEASVLRSTYVAVGSPIPGVTVALTDEAELVVNGLCCNLSYLSPDDPFNGSFCTGDSAEIVNGVVFVTGRIGESGKVNGVTTTPAEVTAAFVGTVQPCVCAAIITDGKSFLFTTAPFPEDYRETMQRKGIPWNIIPSKVLLLDSLPKKGAAGKVDSAALRDLLSHEVGAASAAAATVSTEVEKTAEEIVAAVLSAPSVNVKDSFVNLGGDSFLSITLSARLRRAGFASLSVDDILGSDDIADIVAMANGVVGAGTRKRRKFVAGADADAEKNPSTDFAPSADETSVSFKACVDSSVAVSGDGVIFGACQSGSVIKVRPAPALSIRPV